MTISIIVALAENNVIGNNNDLIWHISDDLKRFKKLTSHKPIIMGRKTYESLPFKPLPNRKNIVITKNKDLVLEGAIVVNSPDEALKIIKSEEEVFICGGAEIYKHFLSKADKLYLTKVYKEFKGDTFFPKINYDRWKLFNSSGELFDEKSELKYSFSDYELV